MQKRNLLISLFFILFLFLFLKNGISVTQLTATPEMLLESFQKEFEPVKPLMPPGIILQDGFVEGKGPAIGMVQGEQGQVYVVHQGSYIAYVLKKDYPLYMGDLIVTDEQSRIQVGLQDQSVFSLAAYGKLTIDKCLYTPQEKDRSTRLSFFYGRARFIISPLAGKDIHYEIKTPTALCKVHGSDFALAVTPNADAMTSFRPFSLGSLFSISEAHAAIPAFLLTTLVTGQNTTVLFSGLEGGEQPVGPLSLCAAGSGAAITPVHVGAKAEETLNTVGPGLASISMPPQ
ncbi:MAG: hypothetical protein EHM45_05585 [Desulfobacteraceae bacterium]|nr:MAG: hypothetical protein EHM45_05585 [Desulfobacteraceae bacterium]